jgi:hypothetical protein
LEQAKTLVEKKRKQKARKAVDETKKRKKNMNTKIEKRKKMDGNKNRTT